MTKLEYPDQQIRMKKLESSNQVRMKKLECRNKCKGHLARDFPGFEAASSRFDI